MSRARWLPFAVLPLVGILAAGLILALSLDDEGEAGGDLSAARFPTPAPVTFIPPTPRPTPTPPADAVIDQPAPDFVLATLDGGSVHLHDLQGQVVFLNFWATWCEPCRKEMPVLQALEDRDESDQIRVIAVADPETDPEADIRAFVERYEIRFTIGLSSDLALYQHYDVLQIPMTYIIDRAGIVRFRHLGALDEDLISDYLGQLSD
jgi:peroxiredoxin